MASRNCDASRSCPLTPMILWPNHMGQGVRGRNGIGPLFWAPNCFYLECSFPAFDLNVHPSILSEPFKHCIVLFYCCHWGDSFIQNDLLWIQMHVILGAGRAWCLQIESRHWSLNSVRTILHQPYDCTVLCLLVVIVGCIYHCLLMLGRRKLSSSVSVKWLLFSRLNARARVCVCVCVFVKGV